MKPTFNIFASAAVLAVLAGCSSSPRIPDYACPLNEETAGKCATVSQVYQASRTAVSAADSRVSGPAVQSVFDPRVQAATGQAAAPSVLAPQLSAYPEPGAGGMPVFQQPKVMRPWVAPYVDADGNLNSGEYVYFSTPGRWNYGELRKPGAAGGSMFGPARPENLGFTPNTAEAPKTAKPLAPAEPPKSAKPVESAGEEVVARPGGQTNAAGVVQPYQRLK